MSENTYDVIVVGAGPAGATAATLLAQQGHHVLMIDRDQHPRFHIGESLLPMGEPIFQRLGIQWDKDQYLPKGGAEFIDEASGQSASFLLASNYQPHQVERAKLDLMMVENAAENGVILHQNEAVQSVDIDEDTVRVTTRKARYSARFLIDASGRSAIMGRKCHSIERISGLGRFALYTHYKNANSTAANALFQTGNIKILMVDIGWIWIIPLMGQRLSVGLVVKETADTSEKGDALFNQYLTKSAILTDLIQGAEQENPVQAEADFSFSNRQRYGTRFACCGDAAGFLDPVFSSGVFIALNSAERVADRLDDALKNSSEADPLLHKSDDKDYLLGFNSMLLFVERFYSYDLVHHLLFEANSNHSVKEDIIGLLGGNLWTEDNQFQQMLLNSRQKKKSVA